MKIIIDHSNLIVGGGIQVGTSFINDLKKLQLYHEYYIIQSPYSAKAIQKDLFPENFTFIDLKFDTIESIFKRRKEVRRIEGNIKPDVIFTTFGPSYHKSKYPKIVGFAIPYLIYPDSPFFSTINFKEKLKYKLLGLIKRGFFIKNSDVLIFETEDARSIFAKSVNDKIRSITVSNTINEIFLDKARWGVYNLVSKEAENLKILCLSANYPHKNLSIIPKVIDCLIDKYEFCNFKFYISLSEENLNFGEKYRSHIEYLGQVNLLQIPDLYDQMDLVFIPTLLEVFSATYLEAMYMKKPIIASSMSFAKDICSNAALYCEPLNVSQYAEAIVRINTDCILRNNLIENGIHNYKRFGSSIDRSLKYLEIIQEITKKYDADY